MTNPELAVRICEKLADSMRSDAKLQAAWNAIDIKERVVIIAAWEKMVEKELDKNRDS